MPAPIKKGPFLVCQRSGKIVGFSQRWRLLNWFFPLIGLAALLWWLIRVLPKPSRATYPCQRVAMPIALGGLSYVLSLLGVIAAFRHARRFFWQHRFVLATVCAVAGLVSAVVVTIHIATTSSAATVTPNPPIGIARGINPGRVVWSYDPAACSWSGSKDGTHWWDSNKVNQARVEAMLSASLRSLTSTTNDAAAWDALFRSFNLRRGLGNISYAESPRKGIAIKINQNPCNTVNLDYYALNGVTNVADGEYSITGSPHLILALVKQLVTVSVAETNIVVLDASGLNRGWGGPRTIGDNIYQYIHPLYPGVRFVDGVGKQGRELAVWPSATTTNIVYPINASGETTSRGLRICQQILDAGFFINMAILKDHDDGPTLCGKNNYGSVSGQRHGPMYGNRTPTYYSNLIPLMGHQELGEKTLLYMLDGLYGAASPNVMPTKWKMTPFKTNWPNSVFLSQDGVAIDCVGFDFLNAEWGQPQNTDYHLLEAAYDPGTNGAKLSGVTYRPTAGTNLVVGSLGTAEHWNNATNKLYSRNLGTGTGIELVANTDANLALAAAASGPAVAGYRQTYILTVTNNGPVAATSAAITNIWPAAATFVSAAASQGSCATNGSGALIANLGTLATASVATVTITVAFPVAATGFATNDATVTAAQRDAYIPDNRAMLTSEIQADTDADGMPDVWEQTNFHNPTNAVASADADGDGQSNLHEYLAGTGPNAASSVLCVTGIAQSGGFVLDWLSVPGKTYQIRYCDDLHGTWNDLPGARYTAAPGQTSLSHTDVTSAARRFYRIQVVY